MGKKKVLIVEDDKELCELMKIRLEDEKYEVLSAEDGDEAVRIAKAKCPDIIVLDVFLPSKDGFAVLKELKSQVGTPKEGEFDTRNIPVIIITGRAPMMEDMFRIEGAIDFLHKPVDVKALVERIKKAIGASE